MGLARNYDISFLEDSAPRALSTIAGEISTGKTSVLEFIDYCLGARNHPRHPEIQRKVHGALLELDLSGEIQVIERRVFSNDQYALVHGCSLDALDRPHARSRRRLEAGDPRSLSALLLAHCELSGISLREAPSQPSSRTDPLSFRDVMGLAFMPNSRLDGKQLLNEGAHMRELKLRQVIEVVFQIHDDQQAKLGDALEEAKANRASLEGEIRSLQDFLLEQEVPERLELDARRRSLIQERAVALTELTQLSQQMRAVTEYAAGLRARFANARRAAAQAASRARDRATLLRRLEPLQGQYNEDESKLIFFAEVHQLFDPLQIGTCPACLQPLPETPEVVDAACGLCGQGLPTADAPVDVKRELDAVRQRRRELDRYIAEVRGQLTDAQRAQSIAGQREAKDSPSNNRLTWGVGAGGGGACSSTLRGRDRG